MKIHAITHASFEGLGAIASWIEERGLSLTQSLPYKGEALPTVDNFDFLIIMGGPQSARHLHKYPYLYHEIELIQAAITHNKCVLGICLGAQLIAEALGAKTHQSPQKELGAFPINLLASAQDDPVFQQWPSSHTVMHWHGDMPGIPDKAVRLAESSGCPNQAFRYGDRVYALQYHLELTHGLTEQLALHCKEELGQGGEFVQPKTTMLQTDFDEINCRMFALLEHLSSLASSAQP